jgi:hypothetical protein
MRRRVASCFGGAAAAVLAVMASAGDARADDVELTTSDGSYGRVEGDLLFVGELAAGLGLGGFQLETHVSLLYLSTAGGYVRYVEAFDNASAPYARGFAVGLELRPLFLGRYALDLEKGPPHADLLLDSLTLVLGATWLAPQAGPLEPEPGIELGLGLELPFLPRASGPHVGVTALARWGADDISGARELDFLERGAMLLFALSWHQVFDANLVDFRDPPPSR